MTSWLDKNRKSRPGVQPTVHVFFLQRDWVMKTVSIIFALGIFAMTSEDVSAQILRAFSEPARRSHVAASEPGIVKTVFVRSGEHVEAGQLLAELNNAVLKQTLAVAQSKAESTARIDAAKAEQTIRQIQFSTLRDLDENGHANQFELERSRLELEAVNAEYQLAVEEKRHAEIEVNRIKAQLERRSIRSPFDGIVTDIHKEVGEYLSPTAPDLATVVQLRTLKARFYLTSKQVANVKKGMVLQVRFASQSTGDPTIKDDVINATVDYVAPVLNPKSGTAEVDVLIENKKLELRSGMECFLTQID